MVCIRPYQSAYGTQYGCGQCIHCRINRQRELVARIALEMRAHPDASFVTLTYSDENLPKDESLDPKSLSNFLKRLRKCVGSFRFYACGEYGEKFGRPHYHLLLTAPYYLLEPVMEATWQKGNCQVGPLLDGGMYYASRYVLKKLTKETKTRENGRYPEFNRRSLRPGLGKPYIPHLAAIQTSRSGSAALARTGDVFDAIRFRGKVFPLDRYMRQKLREEIGLEEWNRDAKEPPSVADLDVARQAASTFEYKLSRGTSKRLHTAKHQAA